ncbi:MAG TPA: formate hydrogenlyase, partial [Candidatus Thioglobus sp.]|nr:formate hydrogenlyase [Candidatus Thioglobus sp.]
KPYMIHIFHEQFEEEHKINPSASGQTSIVESSDLSNYVNAKSGLYFALYLLFA